MTTTTPQRIGGWLLGPLAWLLVALLSTTLALLLYTAALSSPQTFQTLGGQALTTQILWGVSFITATFFIGHSARRTSVPGRGQTNARQKPALRDGDRQHDTY